MRKGIRSIKRGTAVLLSACMVFGMTPIQAGAEETGISVSGNETQAEPLESGSDEQTEGSASGNETQTQVEPSGFGSDEQAEGSASGNETQTQMELSGFGSDAQTQAGAEENDSEIAVQANDSAGRTEQQSTDEASVTINGTTLYYATLEEAFSAADRKTATINMLNDAECINHAGIPFCVDSWESDITLKMNGKFLCGQGKEGSGAITVKAGSLAIQGPGIILSIHKGLSCESNARNIAVENVTFDLNSCDYGIWVDSMYPVILDNVQVCERAYKGAVYINNSDANVTINNMSAPEYGRCDVVYNGDTLKINGGTFDKISDCVYRTSVSNVLGEGCIYRNNEDKTWVTSDLSDTYEISNVTVEKIPLTINPEAEATSWYYNSAEHSLQMNAQPTTTGNEITYEWYDGDKKLECTSDTYTVPKTTPIGSYTYTCKATCDGYTLSHEFKFAVEECKHENVEITFNSNGFGNCPKCNATVYQPATETNDKYDIDDDGTKEAVYEISNAGQLYWFAGLVNGDKEVCTGDVTQDLSAKAVLTADITVNTGVLNADGTLQADTENLRSWTPVGSNTGTEENAANGYSGTFDGQNHTISGLYFDDANADAVGLFGYITENSQVFCVGITDSYFNGRNYVGAVCGKNDGIIRNCYNTGTVSGSQYVGGVNGYNSAKVANCYNIGTIHAKTAYNADGVAYSASGETHNSYYLAGCAASGTRFTDYHPNESKTAEQFACGEVAYLLSQGYTYQWNDQDCESYDGSAWGQDLSREASWPVLDVTKKVYCGYKDCSGKTYANEPLSETPNHKEFDANGFCTVCGGYQPAVKNAKGIYEIGNVGQLYWFAGLVNGTLGYIDQDRLADAVLTKDITVNSNVLNPDGTLAQNADSLRSWTPIGSDYNNQYTGTFDGQNHTISGLYLDNPDKASVGLFGSIGSDYNNGNNKCARISNVNLVDSYFNAGSNVGGVCGQSAYLTSIENCRNAGTVKGDSYVGGICGDNSGTIQICINTGAVSGTGSSIGGISGQTSRIIVNCYNTGAVSGIRYSVGGVCGSVDYGTIINSYNTGVVSGSESDEYSSIGGVCGQYSNGNIVNCYYLAGCAAEGTTFNNTEGERTKEQFASGEIAYLLDQEYKDIAYQITYDGAVWGQKLGNGGDKYPVFSENKVYRNITYKGCIGNPGETDVVYSNTKADPVYAEHTDEDLDGKCDICKLDFKTFKQLGLLIAKVNKNLSDGKYADVQYTTASIDNLRMALVAAGAVTEASSDTDIATAFDKLLAASTVGADGLIKADHNIVISFANSGAVRGIASGNGWYANGETVTLKVTPSMGYSFSKWTTDKAGNTSVGTESTYTFTLDAGSPDVYHAWLDEAKYTVTCESVEGGTGKASEEQYVYGQTATVTATANDDYEFVGWKDSYGTTVSTDATYSFTVLGDTALTPEFVKVKTEEGNEIAYVTVSFYHQSGKLLDSQKVVSGEGKINTTVNAPTKVGFDFLGWSAKASGATAEDVVDFETATFSENTSLYPVFKAQDIMYTLTVVGLQTEQKAPQSSVTVTADPIEGKQFVGWKDANGNIVSYDSTYTFIITGDTTLEACYEQADSVIVKEPTIIIGEPIISVKQQGVSKKATMYFNYDIPDGNELVDIGVVYVSGKKNTLDMNTPGVVIRSAMSTINASPNNVKNQFYYSKTMTADSEYTFMGYIVYTDSSGKRVTKYSDLKNASYND